MEKAPTHLDLFSGIGGFAIACRWAGFRTVAFVEIDGYCRKVLAKNFMANAERNGWQPRGAECAGQFGTLAFNSTSPPIFTDIFDLNGTQFRGVSLITGGFPCQPFSVAGKRRGTSDDRAIWPEMFRVISEARPAWVLGENVPGLIPMELDNVLSDLEGIGYATRAFVIPACAVDARHRRDRLWIVGRRIGTLADSIHDGHQQEERRIVSETTGTQEQDGAQHSAAGESDRTGAAREGEGLATVKEHGLPDTGGTGLEGGAVAGDTGGSGARGEEQSAGLRGECRWEPEPDVGRVAHGIPSRVDRLKGLGNAIVPQVAFELLREIRKLI